MIGKEEKGPKVETKIEEIEKIKKGEAEVGEVREEEIMTEMKNEAKKIGIVGVNLIKAKRIKSLKKEKINHRKKRQRSQKK